MEPKRWPQVHQLLHAPWGILGPGLCKRVHALEQFEHGCGTCTVGHKTAQSGKGPKTQPAGLHCAKLASLYLLHFWLRHRGYTLQHSCQWGANFISSLQACTINHILGFLAVRARVWVGFGIWNPGGGPWCTRLCMHPEVYLGQGCARG